MGGFYAIGASAFSAFAKVSGHPEVYKVMSGLLGFPAPTTCGIGADGGVGYLGATGWDAGGLVWLGMYLRHQRVRALLPLTSASR